MPDRTDEELIQNTLEGDENSFNELVTRYQKPIFNFCFKFLPRSEDAEEAVIDTFYKVHKNASSFDSQYRFSTWIYSIARNCSLDIIRKVKKHRQESSMEYDIPCSSDRPEDLLFKNDKEDKLHQAFLELDETKRIALILYIYHEHSYRDIAEVLTTTENNIKNIIYRARQKLKEILGANFYTEE